MQSIKHFEQTIFLFTPNVIAILYAVSWTFSQCIGAADLCMQLGAARTSAFHNNLRPREVL